MDTPAYTQQMAAIENKIRQVLPDDEDSVQDVLLQLVKRQHAIKNLEHYALRAAKHLKWHRQRQHKRTLPDEYWARTANRRVAGPEEEVVRQEQIERLESAIATLPPSQRVAIEDRLVWPQSGDGRRWRSRAMRNSAGYRAIKTLRRKLTSISELHLHIRSAVNGRTVVGDTIASVAKRTVESRLRCLVLKIHKIVLAYGVEGCSGANLL